MTITRKKSDVRKEEILAKALPLAEVRGYRDISRQEIMDAVGASGPVINHHFGTMPKFRRALMRYAVQHECLAVIAQGLAASDPHARKAPEALRRAALDSLM